MNHLEKLQTIFRDVFADPTLRISPETAPINFSDWDSVAQVHIVLALESEYGFQFTTDEVALMHSVSDLLQVIERKA